MNARPLIVGNNDNNGLNGNNNFNNNGRFVGITLSSPRPSNMITYNSIYHKIISIDNLELAWLKARKGKTKKSYVLEFEKNIERNLLELHEELASQTYFPRPLETFILRDPKTRKISKSDFRDRIVHHAIVNILEPIFDKTFIYDSYANRKGKGTLKALHRFDFFVKKVSKNNKLSIFVLKADIKHYFNEVNHTILIEILKRKISDDRTILLIEKILKNSANFESQREIIKSAVNDAQTSLLEFSQNKKGMPLGNLTSQFFANLYLNELDNFVKRKLHIKNYIRYVDDFVIIHRSKQQLEIWKGQIDDFLNKHLKLTLHPQKTRIISLSRGVDFVGFRNFHHHKLLRKRNLRKIYQKLSLYEQNKVSFTKMRDSYIGWRGFARWGNTYKRRENVKRKIIDALLKNI